MTGFGTGARPTTVLDMHSVGSDGPRSVLVASWYVQWLVATGF